MDFINEVSNLKANEFSSIPISVGYITLAISIIFYGSFFVPVKKFETGDGMFFQLVLCLGIWSTSYVINWIRDFPKFYALPMLCGLLWTTGNVASVPIIKFIGLALGMLIWGVISLIVGWANARFGIWGNKAQVPKVIWMNYVGVALAVVSAIAYVFVKSEVPNEIRVTNKVDAIDNVEKVENKTSSQQELTIIDRINPNLKRIFGIVMSIFSGVMYGFNYAPILYVMDNYENASQNGLDYVFSFYSGLLAASIVYFLIYCIAKRNKPVVYMSVILPGFISGVLWGVANCCFLLASSSLSQAVTFPIGASGPPMIASLWGILVYKEVKGKKNLIILGSAFSVTLVGAVLTGLSNN